MERLRVTGLTKRFGGHTVLQDISFTVEPGEFCILLGPSGCGKSTLLRLLAGLEDADAGTILLGDRPLDGLTPRQRDVAMVFQNYALYPHKTVRQNLAFPLRARKRPRAEIRRRVEEAAELLDIGPLLDRKPRSLSGGQRQRVAIGRAIVREPRLFLFDEPLSNLDAQLRTSMRVELAKLHRVLGTTVVYVTHDQVEAMTLGHTIVLLHGGRIQQQGPAEELYERPVNPFVARFVGSPTMNLVRGVVGEDGAVFRSPDLELELPAGTPAGAEILVGVRPEDLVVGEGSICGRVEVVEAVGHETFVHVTAGETALVARVVGRWSGGMGDTVQLRPRPGSLHLFRGGERLPETG